MAACVESQMLSDGVFIGEVLADECVVYDRNTQGGGRVAFFNYAAAQETRADGFKIVRANKVVDCIIVV